MPSPGLVKEKHFHHYCCHPSTVANLPSFLLVPSAGRISHVFRQDVDILLVTAVAGGGGGSGGGVTDYNLGGGGGGGGAEGMSNHALLHIKAGDRLILSAGRGGEGGPSGKPGKNGTETVIVLTNKHGQIVNKLTLSPGKGGTLPLTGSLGGEAGGGFGSTAGSQGAMLPQSQGSVGGAAGGSSPLAIGGKGGEIDKDIKAFSGTDGFRGSGGGGGSSALGCGKGGKGGDGFILIQLGRSIVPF